MPLPLAPLPSPSRQWRQEILAPVWFPPRAVTPANIFLAAPRLWLGLRCRNTVVGYSRQMSFSVYISPYQGFFLTPAVSGFGGGRAMSWDYLRHPFSSARAGAFRCQTAPKDAEVIFSLNLLPPCLRFDISNSAPNSFPDNCN